MTTMILAAVVTANLPSTLRKGCPSHFFGTPTVTIRTEEDCLNAIKFFCEHAPAAVVETTAKELKVLSEVNPTFYNLVNELLWKVNFPLSSAAWKNHYQLLNKHLD